MSRIKILSTLVLATIFLATQIMVVSAAPATQETPPITGTVVDITMETDSETEVTTVLGLINEDGTVNEDAKGTTVEIDPSIVLPDAPEEPVEENQHPVGSALSDFFSDLLGVDYKTIMEYHEEGVGFGVIAQALWMTNALEGDSEIFAAILDARETHDFSGITLPK